MSSQLKPILIIVAILAVVGAAGYGLHRATQGPAPTETVDQGAETPATDEAQTAEASGEDAQEEGAVAAIPPTFDIVRVEPTGEIVAAGQSSAGAHVWLMNEAETLAEADANVDGEWAMVADQALPPGSYDLALKATGENGNGAPVEGDRATIIIEAPDETPLVAVTRPGEPTQVLQKPEPEDEAPSETVVAAVAPDAGSPDNQDVGAKDEQPASRQADGTADTDARQGDDARMEAGQDAGATREAEEDGSDEARAAAPASGETDTGATASENTDTARTAAQTGDQRDEPAAGTDQAGEEQTDQAAAQSAPTQSAPTQSTSSQSDPAARDDASRQETSTAADNEPAASDRQEQAVAALSDGSDGHDRDEPVAARDDGATQDTQDDSSSARTALAEDDSPAARTDDTPQDDRPVPQGAVTIETVEIEDPDSLMLGGQAEPGDAVRVYMNNERLDDVETDEDGRWTLSETREMPPGRYTVRADIVDDEGDVTSRAEVKFDRVMTIAEEEAGGADGTRTVNIVSRAGGAGAGSASGGAGGAGVGTAVVVIARGDNLWRIARKIYGRGVRHSVIYEANRNQIRNPHRIYPGQVFTIPVLEGENDQSG